MTSKRIRDSCCGVWRRTCTRRTCWSRNGMASFAMPRRGTPPSCSTTTSARPGATRVDGRRSATAASRCAHAGCCTPCSTPEVAFTHPEDESICVVNRELLERRHGVRIAPADVARHFSYERVEPPAPTFGFHGLFNFPRELTADEVTEIVAALPDRLTRGLDAHDLCAYADPRGPARQRRASCSASAGAWHARPPHAALGVAAAGRAMARWLTPVERQPQ